jgi:hypothetical protein
MDRGNGAGIVVVAGFKEKVVIGARCKTISKSVGNGDEVKDGQIGF